MASDSSSLAASLADSEIVLRPRAGHFVSASISRIGKSAPLRVMLAAAAAGLISVFALAQSTVGPIAVAITIAIAIVGLGAIYAVVFLLVATTKWRISNGQLTISDRLRGSRSLPLNSISSASYEELEWFGSREAVIVFRDRQGNCVLWTVTNRWNDSDLEPLWNVIGLRPASTTTVNDYVSLPDSMRG